jgi:hypothetical protein
VTTYVGIDPGASGGLAGIYNEVTDVKPMPRTLRDVWEWFEWLKLSPAPVFAYLEKVQGYIGIEQPGNAAFKFGRSFGILEMALTAAGIPFEEVPPQRWQKGLGITPRRKDETKTQFKNRLKQHAQNLFPEVKLTLATCDALLLAEYARRTHV